ncbi:hypothetical protein K1719_001315 [Acacia pycnantha]|nr:hypothetical protein K1719_001315 [Acacia pycnantha]
MKQREYYLIGHLNKNISQEHPPALPAHPLPSTPPPNKDYQVYFPVTEIDAPTTSLPITGLSPLSAVTFGLNRIHLKHRPDLLEDDLTLNPTKKRLTFPEPEATTILTNSPILARMELQARMSILLKNPFGGIKVNSQTRLLSYFQLLLRLTRTRSGMDSRLWLENKMAQKEKDGVEFVLLIYAYKRT